MRNLKNFKEISEYLTNVYSYELEDFHTKNGIQRRLKDNELEQELKAKIKKEIQFKELITELKLGPKYNMTPEPWIQIATRENKSGAKGRYMGIDFDKKKQEVSIWLGFGRSGKKKGEIVELIKLYVNRYMTIEPVLKNEFQYMTEFSDAVFIKKNIKIQEINEENIKNDMLYLANLYKKYEAQFENSVVRVEKVEGQVSNDKVDVQELNKNLLTLIEEVGRLAATVKKLL